MDDLLQQGVNSYKSGNHETARILFISATKQNPDSEHAWGWLYTVCKTDQERIHCLKQITRINPENVKAKELLAKLTELEPPLELLPFFIARKYSVGGTSAERGWTLISSAGKPRLRIVSAALG